MPYAEITSVTVTTVWDDNSVTDTQVAFKRHDDGQEVIYLTQDDNKVAIYFETWGELRDQIQGLFDTM